MAEKQLAYRYDMKKLRHCITLRILRYHQERRGVYTQKFHSTLVA